MKTRLRRKRIPVRERFGISIGAVYINGVRQHDFKIGPPTITFELLPDVCSYDHETVGPAVRPVHPRYLRTVTVRGIKLTEDGNLRTVGA